MKDITPQDGNKAQLSPPPPGARSPPGDKGLECGELDKTDPGQGSAEQDTRLRRAVVTRLRDSVAPDEVKHTTSGSSEVPPGVPRSREV